MWNQWVSNGANEYIPASVTLRVLPEISGYFFDFFICNVTPYTNPFSDGEQGGRVCGALREPGRAGRVGAEHADGMVDVVFVFG